MSGKNRFRDQTEAEVNRGNNRKSGPGSRCRRDGSCRKTDKRTQENGFQQRKRSHGSEMTGSNMIRVGRGKGQV